MLDEIKNLFNLKVIDKYIANNDFETALQKLNVLIKESDNSYDAYMKRAKLCKKLLMLDDAYSDLTYVISHFPKKSDAYYERMLINYEIGNFSEAITDAEALMQEYKDNSELNRIKFLSLTFLSLTDEASKFLLEIFDNNKYKIIQFLLKEIAKTMSANEHAKSLKLLDFMDVFDKDNPIKLLNEANIYGFVGDVEKQEEILKKIDSIFPKYFIEHFKYSDMYESRDLLEVYFLLELKMFDKHSLFEYQMLILEGYKNWDEGHITDAKECFEKAIQNSPNRPDAYVLLAQTLQLMSGYENPEYIKDAEENYKIAMNIYEKDKLSLKAEEMRRQIKHLNSKISLI